MLLQLNVKLHLLAISVNSFSMFCNIQHDGYNLFPVPISHQLLGSLSHDVCQPTLQDDACFAGPSALLAATSLWPSPPVQHLTRRLCSCQLPFWPTICTLALGCSRLLSCIFCDDVTLASDIAVALPVMPIKLVGKRSGVTQTCTTR